MTDHRPEVRDEMGPDIVCCRCSNATWRQLDNDQFKCADCGDPIYMQTVSDERAFSVKLGKRVQELEEESRQWDKESLCKLIAERDVLTAELAQIKSAPPIEPVGLRGALERMVANSVCIIRALRERGGTDEAWFDELIAAEKQAHAALAALLTWRKEQP